MTNSDESLVPVAPSALDRSRLDQNPAAVYLARLTSPASRRSMRQALDAALTLLTGEPCPVHTGERGRAGRDAQAAAHASGARCAVERFEWARLSYQYTSHLRARAAEAFAPRTANKIIAAVRGALEEAWRLGQMSAEEYQRAADLKTIRASTLPAGRGLTPGEIRALFDACRDGTAAGTRDAALFAILYGAGLRRSEAVALDLADYDAETGAVTVRHGKGRKERITYAPAGARSAIDRWLVARGLDAGPLFRPVTKGGQVLDRRMSSQVAFDALRVRCEKAGVRPASPHDLRRSFISDHLDAGTDISTVQKLAGHENVVTTQRYDRRGEETKRQAAERLHVPY